MWSAFPIELLPAVILSVLGYVFLYWFSRVQQRRIAKFHADNADKTVAAIARRLGLAVVEGDPDFNLGFSLQAGGDFDRQIFLRGQPYGRPTTFQLVESQRLEENLWSESSATVKQAFTANMAVCTTAPFPAFEVVLRRPHHLCLPPLEFRHRTDLREVSTGNARLDEIFVVRAADPRVGPALAGALTLLVGHVYVHMAGDAGRIWTSLTRIGVPYFAYAPEVALVALATAACGLEGRRAPAELVAPMLLNPASSP